MYIPDRIKVVLTGGPRRLKVFAADEGHESDPSLEVTRVFILYAEDRGDFRVSVTYGQWYQAIGKPEKTSASVEYGSDKVTFSVES